MQMYMYFDMLWECKNTLFYERKVGVLVTQTGISNTGEHWDSAGPTPSLYRLNLFIYHVYIFSTKQQTCVDCLKIRKRVVFFAQAHPQSQCSTGSGRWLSGSTIWSFLWPIFPSVLAGDRFPPRPRTQSRRLQARA